MKILWVTIVAITAFVFAISLAIQTPAVQTFIADKVTRSLSEKLDGNISFERIHFKPFTTFILKNVVITDKNPFQDPTDSTAVQVDTFFCARYLIANMTLQSLSEHEGIHIDKVKITDGVMNLVLEDNPKEEGDQYDNLSRIFRITIPEVKKKPSEKEIFHIARVSLENFTFSMKNYSSEKTPYYGGINWNDLDIHNINLNATSS